MYGKVLHGNNYTPYRCTLKNGSSPGCKYMFVEFMSSIIFLMRHSVNIASKRIGTLYVTRNEFQVNKGTRRVTGAPVGLPL